MDKNSTGGNKIKEKYHNEHRTMKPKLKYSMTYCPSMCRPLDFSVKGPVPIYIHKKQKVLTGCSYIELKLQKPSKVGEITFRNYYASSVSILLLRANTQGPTMGSRNWEIGIKNRILMKQPHCENGAQDYFSLFSTEAWNNVSKLKIILRQPSPMCKTFHLEEIKLYADVPRFGRPVFEVNCRYETNVSLPSVALHKLCKKHSHAPIAQTRPPRFLLNVNRQKLPTYLIQNTTKAITWKPNKLNEISSHRLDINNKAQKFTYVIEQVPISYDSSKI